MTPRTVFFRMNPVGSARTSFRHGLSSPAQQACAPTSSATSRPPCRSFRPRSTELTSAAGQPTNALKAAAAPAAAPAVVVNPPPAIPAPTDIGLGSALVPVPRLLQIKTAGGSFMVYGDIDEYLNHMRSSSGAKINALQDGAILRSRLGFTGTKDFGSGYGGAFTLETGFNATNGTQADQPNANTTGLTTSGRLFDRQAWAGMTSPYGELRAGRQNGRRSSRARCNYNATTPNATSARW